MECVVKWKRKPHTNWIETPLYSVGPMICLAVYLIICKETCIEGRYRLWPKQGAYLRKLCFKSSPTFLLTIYSRYVPRDAPDRYRYRYWRWRILLDNKISGLFSLLTNIFTKNIVTLTPMKILPVAFTVSECFRSLFKNSPRGWISGLYGYRYSVSARISGLYGYRYSVSARIYVRCIRNRNKLIGLEILIHFTSKLYLLQALCSTLNHR